MLNQRIDAGQLQLKDTVVSINRVTKVVKGGKNMSFAALVVIGDEAGHVGFGTGKAKEVPNAIKKAVGDSKNVSEALRRRVDDVAGKVEKAKSSFRSGFNGPKFRYLDLAGQLQASTSAPTEAQMTTLEHLGAELMENITAVNALITGDIPAIEGELRSNALSTLKPVPLPK